MRGSRAQREPSEPKHILIPGQSYSFIAQLKARRYGQPYRTGLKNMKVHILHPLCGFAG